MRVHLIQPKRTELAARWQWHRALGVAFLAFAVGAIGCAIAGREGPLAWALLGLALAYGAAAILMTGERARWLQAAVALAYAEAGAVLLVDRQFGPLLLLFALSAAFVIGGLAQTTAAMIRPHAQSRLEAGSGILLVAVGVMVALRWPLSTIAALGVVFGFAAAAQGAAYLRLAHVGARLSEPRSLRIEGSLARLLRLHFPLG